MSARYIELARLLVISCLCSPLSAQDVPSQANCRPYDPNCYQSSPNQDDDNKPYAGPPPQNRGNDGGRYQPPPPQPVEPRPAPPVRPWRAPPVPTPQQIQAIIDAPTERLDFVSLEGVADDIKIIFQYHMDSLNRFEQRELMDKLREVEMEMDYRSRHRPAPPPGPPPPPPPPLR